MSIHYLIGVKADLSALSPADYHLARRVFNRLQDERARRLEDINSLSDLGMPNHFRWKPSRGEIAQGHRIRIIFHFSEGGELYIDAIKDRDHAYSRPTLSRIQQYSKRL